MTTIKLWLKRIVDTVCLFNGKKHKELRIAGGMVRSYFLRGVDEWFKDNHSEAFNYFHYAYVSGGSNDEIKERPTENLILMMLIATSSKAGYINKAMIFCQKLTSRYEVAGNHKMAELFGNKLYRLNFRNRLRTMYRMCY